MTHQFRSSLSFLSIVVLALLAALPLGAQDGAISSPTQVGGQEVNSRFQFGGIDAVNLFSGNLSVDIPIGGSYPAGGGLDYGLRLAYNSNIWTYWDACVDRGDPAPGSPEELPLFMASPKPNSNAGLGWSINPGRIALRHSFFGNPAVPDRPEVTTYYGPDGSSHAFHPSLHATRLTEEFVPGVEYTRDGSYLRLRSEPAGCHVDSNATNCQLQLDFPDGSTHTFDRSAALGSPPVEWRVTRIEDSSGNWVNLSYEELLWTITDQHERALYIRFAPPQTVAGQPLREVAPRVTEIDLPALGRVLGPALFDVLVSL